MEETNITTEVFAGDPTITKTFALGKIAMKRGGRRSHAVEVTMTLRVHRQHRLTIDLEPVEGYVSVAFQGDIWNTTHTDIDGGGQCEERIAARMMDMVPERRTLFLRILPIWREWHLNDTNAGARAQRDHLKRAEAEARAAIKANGYKFLERGDTYAYKMVNGEPSYSEAVKVYGLHADWYDWAKATLAAANLMTVTDGPEAPDAKGGFSQRSYEFAHGWLLNPLPADVFTEIVDLFCDSAPARDRFEAWAKANGLTLERFGDALRPVVVA